MFIRGVVWGELRTRYPLAKASGSTLRMMLYAPFTSALMRRPWPPDTARASLACR